MRNNDRNFQKGWRVSVQVGDEFPTGMVEHVGIGGCLVSFPGAQVGSRVSDGLSIAYVSNDNIAVEVRDKCE